MINEIELFEKYPSAKTILGTMDRIGQSLDYFTERINRVKIVPLVPHGTKSGTEKAQNVSVVSSGTPNGTFGTKIVPIWETLGMSRRTYYRHKKKGVEKK